MDQVNLNPSPARFYNVRCRGGLLSAENPMSENLVICPDCGGVIGAKTASEHGQPCTCYQTATSAPAGKATTADSSKKICVSCGKDVTHAKRAKDSLGYWCLECDAKDKLRQKPSGTPCPGCGRLVKDSALVEVDGRRICVLCRESERQETIRKARIAGAPTKEFRREEVRSITIMVGVLIFLIVLGVLGWFHLIPHI
jgi:DNA-directed RNA polymerase subunit RPC12/RpoP